ncbi:hypothetical protein HT749_28105 [Burkholderia cepacia]|uniref:hypothetical protein n=1 Tax=Burkholderia cepacia TaxID=292 RepID=UPI00157A38DE|nr:hypothetical protein [Burkholderia cepacia]NTX47261.1 hypothetical protein [Burkholderia cepacia]
MSSTAPSTGTRAFTSLAIGFLSGIEKRKRDIELNLANGRADRIQTFMKKRRTGRQSRMSIMENVRLTRCGHFFYGYDARIKTDSACTHIGNRD